MALAACGMRIGELARHLGTTTKTLRFYEQIGLLGPPQRSEAAYRLYDDGAVASAQLTIGLRQLGLSLDEIQAVLGAERQSSRRQRLLALMDERLRQSYLELSIMQGRCDDLAARHAALLATPRSRPRDCVCDALLRPCACR